MKANRILKPRRGDEVLVESGDCCNLFLPRRNIHTANGAASSIPPSYFATFVTSSSKRSTPRASDHQPSIEKKLGLGIPRRRDGVLAGNFWTKTSSNEDHFVDIVSSYKLLRPSVRRSTHHLLTNAKVPYEISYFHTRHFFCRLIKT